MNHSVKNIYTMMRLFRPIISIMLVLVTTLLVSCSSAPKAKIPTTYTPEKIAQLQQFRTPISDAREQLNSLKDLIADENWVDTRSFIHGPLGGLRQDMSIVGKKLLQKDQKSAQDLGRELFSDFDKIDAAAKERNGNGAKNAYTRALQDFDSYLDLIPSNS